MKILNKLYISQIIDNHSIIKKKVINRHSIICKLLHIEIVSVDYGFNFSYIWGCKITQNTMKPIQQCK